jgi:hypothetical protein
MTRDPLTVAETQKIKAEVKLNYNIDTESGSRHIVNSTWLTLPGLIILLARG